MTKPELRRALLSARSEVENRAEKDRVIRSAFLSLPLHYKKVLLYVSRGEEVDTLGLILHLIQAGKEVYTPRCIPGGNQMRFYRINSLEDLEEGYFRLLEPKEGCAPLTSTEEAVCLVPGLSFTLAGHRIGYGKGYYDRFLRENTVFSVGLCYNELIRDTLPVDSFDEPVRLVITDQFVKESSAYER